MPVDNSVAFDKRTANRKKAFKTKKQNKLAMASLTMAFQIDGMMGILNAVMDTDWPNSLACKVVNAMFRKNVSQDKTHDDRNVASAQ